MSIGKEFTSREFQNYCKENDMRLIHPYTHGHASFIERMHKTVQKMFWNHARDISSWQGLKSLPEIVHSYNNRQHRVCWITRTIFDLFLFKFSLILQMLGNKTPQFAEDNPNSPYLVRQNMKYLSRFKRKKPRYRS